MEAVGTGQLGDEDTEMQLVTPLDDLKLDDTETTYERAAKMAYMFFKQKITRKATEIKKAMKQKDMAVQFNKEMKAEAAESEPIGETHTDMTLFCADLIRNRRTISECKKPGSTEHNEKPIVNEESLTDSSPFAPSPQSSARATQLTAVYRQRTLYPPSSTIVNEESQETKHKATTRGRARSRRKRNATTRPKKAHDHRSPRGLKRTRTRSPENSENMSSEDNAIMSPQRKRSKSDASFTMTHPTLWRTTTQFSDNYGSVSPQHV